MMRVISLGWGCQSFGLAAMSALGVLPRVGAAIHADTAHERSQTYEFARRWTPWLEERGVRVVTVKATRTDVIKQFAAGKGTMIPARTTWPDGTPSGLLRRQCTDDWKRIPIRRWIRANGGTADLWLGITLDEVTRMRESDVKYIAYRYPYLDMLDRRWRRGDVVRWLQEQGLEVPPKSACVFCPYHNRAGWRDIKLHGNGDWQRAIEVDEAIRHARPGFVAYLAHELKPLAEVDFSNEQDHGQLELWGEECEGTCFL